MDAGVQNESLLVKKEFFHVLKDFSQYLLQQKQRGNNFLKSQKSLKPKSITGAEIGVQETEHRKIFSFRALKMLRSLSWTATQVFLRTRAVSC